MNAVTMMLCAAFVWSLYPALIALSGSHVGAPIFVMVIHVSCGVAAAIYAYFNIKQRTVVWHNIKIYTKSLRMDQWGYLALIGLATTLYNFCFVYAMQLTSKTGAAIIIEIWPLFAMFLTPFIITKVWDKISSVDIGIGLIGLIGVALVMLGDKNLDYFMSGDWHGMIDGMETQSIFGMFLALVGSFCVALSIILSTQVANKISTIVLQEKTPSLNCAALAEIVRRLMAIPPSLVLLYAFSDDLNYNMEGIVLSAFTGIVIFNVGSMLMRVALLRSTSPAINMLYYIAPVLAVIWLYFLGMGDITTTIIIGGALVVLSNILIIKRSKKKA